MPGTQNWKTPLGEPTVQDGEDMDAGKLQQTVRCDRGHGVKDGFLGEAQPELNLEESH